MIILNKSLNLQINVNVKMKKYIFLVLLFVGALSSCIDDKYDFDNIDSEVLLSTELVAPIAYSELNVVNIMGADSLGQFELKIDDDTIFIMKTDSQYLGNELIDQLQVLPSNTFDLQVPVAFLKNIEATSAAIEYELPLIFPNINTNENERLDSILMGHSYINVRLNYPNIMLDGSHLSMSFNGDELLLNPDVYPDNAIDIDLSHNDDAETSHTLTYKIDLYGAMLRFKGENSISISFTGDVYTSNEINLDDVFEISLDCSHMKPHLTFINIGNARDIVENETEIEFSYAQDIYDAGMSLPFYDPEIFMTCHNNIGVPARYYIDYVEGICSETGEVVRAQFGDEDHTSLVLNTPSYDEIKHLSHKELLNYDVNKLTKYSQLTLDRENGRTDRLFKIKVDKLRYKYRIRSVEKDRNKVHFFFYNSDIETKEVTKLPLWFEGDTQNKDKNFRLTRKDTLSLSLGSFDDLGVVEETRGVLKLYYKNHLPIGVNAKIKFIDEYDHEILDSVADEFVIKAGEVNNDGVVVLPTEPEEMLMLSLKYSDLESLLNRNVRIVLDYTLENEQHKNILLKSTDWLDLKIMLHVAGGIVLNK